MAAPRTSSRTCRTPTASSSRARTWPSATRSGFQWVMEAKRRGREGHPRRPAVHPHQRGRRPARAAARGQRHRVPRRPDQPRAGRRAVLPGVRRRLHQRADDPARGLPRHRGPRRAVLRLRPGDRHYDRASLAVRGRRRRGGGRASATSGRRPRRAGGRREARRRGRRSTRRGSGGARSARSPQRDETLQHPRCVFQVLKRHFARYTPEMVPRSAASPPRCSPQVAEAITATPAASGRRRSSTRSAGPSTRSGAQYIRARVDPAGAAGQHRPPGRRDPGAARARAASRAPPTSRRCSTCCPATCRCRTRTSTQYLETTSPRTPATKGFWGNMDAYIGEPAQGLVGRRGDARRTTSASTTCPGSPATTAPTSTVLDADRRQGARATSWSARTRPSARQRPDAAARAWPTWSGSSSATCR